TDTDPNRLKAGLAELLRQRADVRRGQVEREKALALSGESNQRQVLELSLAWRKAELGAAETPAERVAARAAIADLWRELVEFQAGIPGGGSASEMMQIRLGELAARIELERARAQMPGADEPNSRAKVAQLYKEWCATADTLLADELKKHTESPRSGGS